MTQKILKIKSAESGIAAKSKQTVTGGRFRSMRTVLRIWPAKRSDDDLFVTAFLVAPAGGSISGVTASSGAGAGEATLYGHDVWRVDVNLYAQESVTITYQVTVSAEAIQELEVHQTPLAQRW